MASLDEILQHDEFLRHLPRHEENWLVCWICPLYNEDDGNHCIGELNKEKEKLMRRMMVMVDRLDSDGSDAYNHLPIRLFTVLRIRQGIRIVFGYHGVQVSPRVRDNCLQLLRCCNVVMSALGDGFERGFRRSSRILAKKITTVGIQHVLYVRNYTNDVKTLLFYLTQQRIACRKLNAWRSAQGLPLSGTFWYNMSDIAEGIANGDLYLCFTTNDTTGDKQLIGYCIINDGSVDFFEIFESFRGCGIGSQFASLLPVRKVSRPLDSAVGFWRRNGFEA